MPYSGIDGYVITGIRKVYANVVFILGVKPLNLLSCDKIRLPLFIVLVIWLTNPCVDILKPRRFPFLLVSISLPFTLMLIILSCGMGIIWNFSSLVLVFQFLSNLLILSIYRSTLVFNIN